MEAIERRSTNLDIQCRCALVISRIDQLPKFGGLIRCRTRIGLDGSHGECDSKCDDLWGREFLVTEFVAIELVATELVTTELVAADVVTELIVTELIVTEKDHQSSQDFCKGFDDQRSDDQRSDDKRSEDKE